MSGPIGREETIEDGDDDVDYHCADCAEDGQWSTTDFVEQVEGAQDTAKKYSVDDEVGGKGVGKANEREEVDDYI